MSYRVLNKTNDLHTEDRTFEGDVSVEDVIVRDDLRVNDSITCNSITASSGITSTSNFSVGSGGNVLQMKRGTHAFENSGMIENDGGHILINNTESGKNIVFKVNSQLSNVGYEFQDSTGANCVEIRASKYLISRGSIGAGDGGEVVIEGSSGDAMFSNTSNTAKALKQNSIGTYVESDAILSLTGGSASNIVIDGASNPSDIQYNCTGEHLFETGNIGIGSSVSPTVAKLHLKENSGSPAVRIEQAGAGDALQVFDQASDSTYFTVDSDGCVAIKRGSKLGTSALTMVGIENTSGVNAITFDTVSAPSPGTSGWGYWSKSMMMGGYIDRTTGEITFTNPNGGTSGVLSGSYFFCDGGNVHIGGTRESNTGHLTDTLANLEGDRSTLYIRAWNGGSTPSCVSIGNTNPSTSAKLEVNATDSGFLPPRMTTAQKNAISSPSDGLVVFDTELDSLCVCNSSVWTSLTGSPEYLLLKRTGNHLNVDTTEGDIVWSTKYVNSPRSLFTHTEGGTVFSVSTSAYYKVEASSTFRTTDTGGEGEIYIKLKNSSNVQITFALGSAMYTDHTTYPQIHLQDIVYLTAGVDYHFEFDSQSDGTADLYGNTIAIITFMNT